MSRVTLAAWALGATLACALLPHAQLAEAGVHKCAGADGKVSFSDRPCPGSAAASAPQAATPKAAATPARPQAAAVATPVSAPAAKPIDPALRAACTKMRDQIAGLVMNGLGTVTRAEFIALDNRYRAECGEVVRQELAKADAKEAAEQAPARKAQDDARCKALRDDVRMTHIEHQALTRQGQPPTDAVKRRLQATEAIIAKEC
jgi:hypothetical protein